MTRFLPAAVLSGLAALLLAPCARADDAPPPPAPAPVAPPSPAEDPRSRGFVEDMPDVLVRDVPLYFEGPLTTTSGGGPLGLGGGPVVPLDAGGARDVIGPERVRDLSPVTVEELAKYLPGVSSRLYSGDEYVRPSISVRGMPDNGFTEYTAVLVDGFNMSTLFYGWTAISIFPFTAERIWAAEVYRGAHALRYGPNTIGGVVNFVTPPIPEEPTLRERVILGTHDYASSVTDVGTTTRDGRFGFLATYVQKGGDTFRDDARFDVNDLALKVLWRFDSSTWISGNFSHWRAVHNLPARLTRAQLNDDPSQNPTPEYVDWHGWAYSGIVTLHHDFGCESWIETILYHRKARRALESARPNNAAPTSVRSSDSDNYNSGVEFRGEAVFHAGVKHRLHYGARYHREEIQREQFEDPLIPGPRVFQQDADTITHAISANVDDTVRFGRLIVNVGVRGEWVVDSFAEDNVTGNSREFDFQEVFPGASLTYETSACSALYANAHRSFRAPQTFSYDFVNTDQELEFEHGENYEVGWRWQNARGTSGSVTLWQVNFSDFIELDPDTDIVTNHGGFRNRGIDVVLEADLARLGARGFSVWGNVTHQRAEFTNGPNDGNDVQFVPEWKAAAGVKYTHPSGAFAGLHGYYFGKCPVDAANEFETGDYAIAGARAGWRRCLNFGCAQLEIEAAATVKNLLDTDYFLRHDALQYIPGAPREVFFELSIGIQF